MDSDDPVPDFRKKSGLSWPWWVGIGVTVAGLMAYWFVSSLYDAIGRMG
jgi:hypothetical protein